MNRDKGNLQNSRRIDLFVIPGHIDDVAKAMVSMAKSLPENHVVERVYEEVILLVDRTSNVKDIINFFYRAKHRQLEQRGAKPSFGAA